MMDRAFLRDHKVNAYTSMDSQAAGEKPVQVLHVRPYRHAGFDSYPDNGTVRPGFVDRFDSTADACVYRSGPGSRPHGVATPNH